MEPVMPNLSVRDREFPELALLSPRPAWQSRALCQGMGTDPFFGRTLAQARFICGMCAVRGECLEMALADPELSGVWGGTTAHERRVLRRAAS
jgi:WhiB family transcriptional regulator, redox-sensing transcriptional regulator